MKKPNIDIPNSIKIKFADSEFSSEDEREIEKELADVTFEELQKARSDGSHTVFQKPKLEKKGGRENKNRPIEICSKMPVGRYREVIQVAKRVFRDPRFEPLCGNLDVEGCIQGEIWFPGHLDSGYQLDIGRDTSQEPVLDEDKETGECFTSSEEAMRIGLFQNRYNFLYESELPAEKENLKNLMKKSNDPEVIAGLKDRLAWINKQLKSVSTKRSDKEILAEHKKKEREAAKQGKQPYYLKKSEIKKQSLIEKYKDLKPSGKLESFLEKRRKKIDAKDRRFMPYRRSNNDEL